MVSDLFLLVSINVGLEVNNSAYNLSHLFLRIKRQQKGPQGNQSPIDIGG